MRTYLTPAELLRGIACIEATIPFRKKDNEGATPSERLCKRIRSIVTSLDENFFGDIDYELIVKECRKIIENDLVSFGSANCDQFLSGTWNVMIENHQALRNTYYLVSEYRKAIVGNIGFFTSLDAKNLYWTDFKSASEKEKQMIENTSRNLQLAIEYMKAIAIGVSLVESIALITGKDAPFEFFFGPGKRSREHDAVNMEKLLDCTKSIPLSPFREEVRRILVSGREKRARFDQKNSPLSGFIYGRLNEADFSYLFDF